jgi:short subunit dehydrogenase-like uncharacterized protein
MPRHAAAFARWNGDGRTNTRRERGLSGDGGCRGNPVTASMGGFTTPTMGLGGTGLHRLPVPGRRLGVKTGTTTPWMLVVPSVQRAAAE